MVSTQVRVRYADTDAMGVVYHANYLVWFEVGRGELMRAWGIPYAQFEAQGIFVPVVDAHLRYISPARYDDLLEVQTRVEELTPARIKFAYQIRRVEDDRLLCEGYTLHAFMLPSGRPVALKKQAPDLYQRLQAQVEAQPQA
jgi:acyl-CoA thioester hydrolase